MPFLKSLCFSAPRMVLKQHSKVILAATLSLGIMLAMDSLLTPPGAQAQIRLKGYLTQTYRQANQLYQVGKWEAAEKIYTQAIRQNPQSVEARANLAVIQAELLKLGAAEQNAREALRLNPKNPTAHIALGTVYRNQTTASDMTYRSQTAELLNKAATEFKAALRFDKNNPEAHNRLGEIYRQQGNLNQAAAEFEKAAELDPRYSEAVANEGTILKAQGDNSGAMKRYRKAIALNSKNNLAHYYLGEALVDEGKYHEALQSLNTALYQNRNSAPVHTKMAEAYAKQGNEAAAISHYRDAIRIKPEYTPAYQKLAALFDNRGDGEFAIAELKSGLNANPNEEQFKLDIGRLALAVEKPDQAILYYKEALRSNPTNAEALRGLSQAYYVKAQASTAQGALGSSDEFVEAEKAIDEALIANPNDISLHLAKLRIARLSGKPEAAKDQLEWLVGNAANTDVEKVAKSEALFTLGRYPESDQLVRQLLETYKADPQQELLLADSLKVNGNLDMAAEVYRQVQAAEPGNLKAERGLQRIQAAQEEARKKLTLAQSLDNWKQRKSAKDFYREAISLYPRQPEARLGLAKIYSNEKAYEKAIFEYQSYLNLVPNLEPRERQRIENKIEDLQQALARQQRA